jgi:hypothetical protein
MIVSPYPVPEILGDLVPEVVLKVISLTIVTACSMAFLLASWTGYNEYKILPLALPQELNAPIIENLY